MATNYSNLNQHTENREPLIHNNSSIQHPQPEAVNAAWKDDADDFEPPCPCIARACPYPCCCCCTLSRSVRQQCALSLLYGACYVMIYVLILGMTLTLLVYDLVRGNYIHDLRSEPLWFVVLDISCVALMVFDVLVQMAAHPENYWKSAMNVFDFVVVLLCVVSIPIYFYVPDSDVILAVILLLRFAAQLLRIVMIYKHHENRSAYMETTRDDLVDFTGLSRQDHAISINGSEPSSMLSGHSNPHHILEHSSQSLFASSASPSYQNMSRPVAVQRQSSSRYNPQWE